MWGRRVALAVTVGVLLAGTVAKEVPQSESDLLRPDRIVGGHQSPEDGFEWQVSLQRRLEDVPEYRHFCGGALVAKNWVATASHCVLAVNMASVRVVAGTKDLTNPQAIYAVTSWVTHQDYNSMTMENDIALIKINTDTNLVPRHARGSFSASPIPVANEREDTNSEFLISGFGHTSYGGRPSNRLLYAKVKGMDDQACRSAISKVSTYSVFKTHLCAGGGAQDACQGDSGGPMVRCSAGMPAVSANCKLVGVTSWGIMCATPGVPGIYTEVSYYQSWINKKISG